MSLLSFGEWRPDVSDYEGQHSRTLLNVFPRGDGYGPVPNLLAYTSALPAVCRGLFYARKNDGSVLAFAGTSTKLYSLSNTDLTWTDVSVGGGSYTALSSNAQWQFRQFNNFVFAVQVNAVPQVYDLTSSSAFANLSGSPPQASYISIINRFVVLSGIASPNVYRVQWSGLNATTTWTSGTTQSDFQDLADGGPVLGVAGGEYGTIFQPQAIRRMVYAPGSPTIFGIERISADDGLMAPYSLISAGDRIFFLSPTGFKMLLPGGYPTPIGKERVDRTFFDDLDSGSIQLVLGANDPRATRVYWAYKSRNGSTGLFDSVIVYDWVLERWAKIRVSGEYLYSLARPGVTLEGVDAAYGSNIDTLTLSSFDDISSAAYSALAGVDSAHKLGFFTGTNLEATLQTAERGGNGRRIRVRGFRPVSDATTGYGSITHRSTAQASATTSSETAVNSVGMCPQNISTRYARGQLRIPAGTSWTFAAGVEPDVVLEGTQ